MKDGEKLLLKIYIITDTLIFEGPKFVCKILPTPQRCFWNIYFLCLSALFICIQHKAKVLNKMAKINFKNNILSSCNGNGLGSDSTGIT